MIVAQSVLIGFFLLAGSIKMFGWIKVVFETQLQFFHRYGLNRRVMFAVGVIEVGGALLLVDALLFASVVSQIIGAGLLAVTSAGAIGCHLKYDSWKDGIAAMITLLLSLWVLWPMLEHCRLY